TGLRAHNWDARQYASDQSTQRVIRYRERKRNVSCNVSVTGDETPPETETETETEQNHTDANASVVNAEVVDLSEASKSRKKETLRAFGEAWNALAAELGLSAIETIKPGSTRERHALARARELVADFPDLAAGLNALAARIRGSPLLRGEIGNRQWRATFDWVVNAANFTKIMEGNYEVRKTTG